MKRIALLIMLLILFVAVFPAMAQTNPDLITLNDATPAIDVVITLPPDTTGTIELNLVMASATLTDADGAIVFYAADARLHGLEFNITPNSGTHTLTVARLPDVTEAYVTVASLPEMTINGTVTLMQGNAISLNEELALPLSADAPGESVTINIPAEETGLITSTFPGAYATTQLIDDSGVIVAESTGGHVDGLSFALDTGTYDFTVVGNGLTDTIIAGVRVVSVVDGGFTLVEAPAVATSEPVVNDTTSTECTATVAVSSVSLRSGPGTAYSVLSYGYRGDTFTVGGQNPENNWIVVGTENGSAWMVNSAAQIQGACDPLTIFDVPLQNGSAAQVVITSASNSTYHDDDDDHESYEHDDDDHENGEHDDD